MISLLVAIYLAFHDATSTFQGGLRISHARNLDSDITFTDLDEKVGKVLDNQLEQRKAAYDAEKATEMQEGNPEIIESHVHHFKSFRCCEGYHTTLHQLTFFHIFV